MSVFGESSYHYTLNGNGNDIDRFNTGTKIESHFYSKGSSSIEVSTGIYFWKKERQHLGTAFIYGYDYLKIRSYEVVELNSAYKIENYGVCFLYQYRFELLSLNASFNQAIGLNKIKAVGTWNLVDAFEQPKSFQHNALAFTVRHALIIDLISGLSSGIRINFTDSVKGRETTYLMDGTTQHMNINRFRILNNSIFFQYNF